MKLILLSIAIVLTTHSQPLDAADSTGQSLTAIRFSEDADLAILAHPSVQLRYLAPDIAFMDATDAALTHLFNHGIEPVFTDVPGAGEQYFLCDHLHETMSEHATLVYHDSAGWALLRLPLDRFGEVWEHDPFLWPLPERYDARGLLAGVSAKPLQPVDSGVVAELIAQVDEERLRSHVESLTLIDPQLGSVAGNIRTRFAFRDETFESTEYIRAQLAAALGDDAVSLQEFPGNPFQTTSRITGFQPARDAIPLYNVIGEHAGTDPEAGYYLICAHYDAIGSRSRGGWNWREDPAPGADDNATGVALVLESARLLSTQSFPWSIRFIAWSGEELGLWGSQHYAEIAREEDHRILGVLNFDMIGFNDVVDRIELVGNPASAWLVGLLQDANQRYNVGLTVDVLNDRFAGLSDHAPFWARGYDAILGIENYLPTDSTSVGVREGMYRLNSQYHAVTDVADSINWELVGGVTRLTVAALAQFGNEEGLPNLAVFSGDARGDVDDDLTIRVSNIGPVDLNTPYRVQVALCDADTAGCTVFFNAERPGPLPAGGVEDIKLEWDRVGEAVLLVHIDPDDQLVEASEEDNRSFIDLRIVPQNRIAVFPNPYRIGLDPFLAFSGTDLSSTRITISALNGEPIWSGLERESPLDQINEVRWTGVNDDGSLVGSGVYIYTVRSFSGDLLRQDKIAVIR